MRIARDTALFALALAVSVSGYAWLGVGAHERAFDALDERVRVAHRRADEEVERAARLEQLLVDVAWLREALELVRSRMQSAEGTPQFLLGLAEVLRAHGLDADVLDPGDRLAVPPLLLQTVALEVRGSFADLEALVAAIEALAPHCRVTALDLSRADAPGSTSVDPRAPLLRARLQVVRIWSEEP